MVVGVVEYLLTVWPFKGVAEVNEVRVQDHLVELESSFNHEPSKMNWSIACDVGCLTLHVLAVRRASDEVVELLTAVAGVDFE